MASRNSNRNTFSDEEFNLKETRPTLGAGCSRFDLVEQMDYIYVGIVKARQLPGKDGYGCPDSFVQVKNGEFKGLTKHFENNSNPEWNQVFSILKDRIQSPKFEILVKDKARNGNDDSIGMIVFDLNDVPRRLSPNSSLAPEWYRLQNPTTGETVPGKLLMAVWLGTQADRVFPRAWQLDATTVNFVSIIPNTYQSPKLWYLKVNVIEALELFVEGNRQPRFYVRVAHGEMNLRTNISQVKNGNPSWNEELMFVVAEPYNDDDLVLFVEDEGRANILGQCSIHLKDVEEITDLKTPANKWCVLQKHTVSANGLKKVETLYSRVLLRMCFEGGYHVFDELPRYSSDLRPTDKGLWKQQIGVLEIGILNAQNLAAMKTIDGRRGVTDAYCVAKYGNKWIRTKTVLNSFNPKWNEQYIWDVYDPCTVITIGVFDNSQLQGGNANVKDLKMGKVRIRLSTLESDRVYTYLYPLVTLLPSGIKKMGEIQLAVRFSYANFLDILTVYTQPLLPNLHYTHPLGKQQIEILRHHATKIVSKKLSLLEPPLRKEVVEYMLDMGSDMFSVRRSKANYSRITCMLSALYKIIEWFDQIYKWKSPFKTVLALIFFLAFVCFPWMMFYPSYFVLFLISTWSYHKRPRHPPHIDVRLSQADIAQRDEIDEEFDTFPTSVKQFDVLKLRYDRLRGIASRVQMSFDGLVTQGEMFYNLLTWRDPMATALFLIFCFVALVVLHVTPLKIVITIMGIYLMRPPMFRDQLPSFPVNFLRRLPAKTDELL